ncbi:MFS transporter [Streptomyces sclerotialus]|uniref:MFS transporter n=1 Tax=Streptomyces sclerotialus TaxID=1957 RepID=UPI0004CA89A8
MASPVPSAGPSVAESPVENRRGRPWLMLVLGTAAQTASFVFVYGVPYLVPTLREKDGLTLTQSGLLVACPTAGLLLTLVLWGAAADRYGERRVLTTGLGLMTLALLGTLLAHGPVAWGAMFVAAGAAGASVSAASGRVVLGWFSARQRGLAMGVRQTSTPLGMGLAALVMPPLAAHSGVLGALGFAAALTGAVTVLVALFVVDPPRATAAEKTGRRTANPYRDPRLWRTHGGSALMVWPQFTAGAFGLVFLTDVLHWSATDAGRLMALGQLTGAACRIGVGRWSDRIGSRLRPMRQLACVVGVLSLCLAVCAVRPGWAAGVVLVLTCGLSASTNGLSFTQVAELAGSDWAGRAMGVQNTGQNLTASLTPPVAGALITATGYAPAFVLAGVCALAATVVTPREDG